MSRSWVLPLLLLLLLVSFVSNASSLVDEQAPKENSNSNTTQASSLPNVKSNANASEPSKSPPPPPPPPLQFESEKNGTTMPNTTDSIDNGNLTRQQILDSEKNGTAIAAETCAGKSKICTTENALVACTLSIDKGSSKWLILVQSEGEESLKPKIIFPVNSLPELTLGKHQSQRLNISISGDTNRIILDAGKGECVLHMDSSEESTLSMIHLPSYEKLATPINGAYFLIVSVIVFGGAGGLCLCRKNLRVGNGVPYRELEFSGGSRLKSESVVHDVETGDWDEGWDDDWDEKNAVKSPGGAASSVSISANGLTARAPSRDGWDHDWDD